MYATCIRISIDPRSDRQKDQTTLIEPVGGVVWRVGTYDKTHPMYTSLIHPVLDTLYLYIRMHKPSRKLTQYSAVATSHNYMSFFKECPIPISSVPINSTSGTSISTGLTLTL